MQTRMSTQAIINTRRYMQRQKTAKPAAMATKGLLLKRSNATMQNENEPESVRLVRMVQESMNNAKSKRSSTLA